MTKIDEPLLTLIKELTEKISPKDLIELRNACKDDKIQETDIETLHNSQELFQYLHDKRILTADDPSFIEHLFELCRRPDLLCIVMQYRISKLGLESDDCIGKKLIRVKSAKKYTEPSQPETDEEKATLKLSDPPKYRRKSATS